MSKESHETILGEMLTQAIKNADMKEPEMKQAIYSPRVILQAGKPSETPLYCVPGAGASVISFTDLVTAMGQLRPIFGLQPRGLDGLQVPHATVEAAAECYAQVILTTHPDGPVNLLGHSFGGWVVFELARRLQIEGCVVDSLIILDSECPGDASRLTTQYSHMDVMLKWIEIFELMLEIPLGISRKNLESWNQVKQLEQVHSRLVSLGRLPQRSRPELLLGPLNVFAAALRTNYTPSCARQGRTFMAVMDNSKLDELANGVVRDYLVNAWSHWAPNLEILNAPGNHMTALHPPHVYALAEWLCSSTQIESEGVGELQARKSI